MTEPDARPPAALVRTGRAWRALAPEGRIAAAAAAGLFVAMFLPWYQQNTFVRGRGIVPHDVSAFGVFSFIEAAVLLVALGVVALLFARAERATFHLPGGDGSIVMAAGAWAALLLVWRLFDKPGVDAGGVNVGVQWGIFFALAAAGVLAYAGSRMRRGQRPPAPRVRERPRPPTESPPPPPGTTATRVLPPERTRRAGGRASVPEDQLTIPLPPADEPG